MTNQTKRQIRGFIQAALFMGISTVVGVNCAGFKASSVFEDGSNGSLGASDEVPVGFLSSDQMLKSMISVAGVESLGDLTTADDNAIDTMYNARTGSLPSVQSLSSATGPTLIAVTNLAGTVCNKAVDNDIAAGSPGDRMFFQEVDFSQGLSQGSAAFIPGFQRLARNAWRRDSIQEEDDMISGFVSEFTAASPDATAVAQTKLLAVSICTSVLSSTDALTY